jgi:cell division septal protein FtsQ
MKAGSVAVICFSALALVGVAFGIGAAMRSPLFIVQVVEVADLPENSPIDAATVSKLAAVPIGKENLFKLDLLSIEQRVKKHPWVKAVQLHKRFPQTLAIEVVLRQPRALLQGEKGQMSYVDADGNVFGKVNLAVQPDLPLLSGAMDLSKRIGSLHLLDLWDSEQVVKVAQLSSITYEEERGYRLLVSYPMRQGGGLGRTMVDLGNEINADISAQFGRLKQVVRYLSDHSISVRQVWADADKKIIVKTVRGS